MQRRVEPEVIDDPSTPMAELEYLLACVRTTNRKLGGVDLMMDCLKKWSTRWPRDRAVTLLDIGTGSADLPLAAAKWGRENGLDLRAKGIDANQRVLDVAARLCEGEDRVELERCDALDLLDERTSPYGPGSFDYVHAGMFIHHFDDATVPRMLAAMVRIARAGIIWNDLIRSRRGYAVSWVATLGRAIRHDCLASLRAGFRKEEVEALRERLGLTYTEHREMFIYQRFTLAGEKPGAWDQAETTVHLGDRAQAFRA